jgi:asparagine synthase (glutamine-hydrolysing)
MCGICGIMSARTVASETRDAVREMSRLIRHRGPDGEGFWDTPNGTLGHRRLSIIDVAGGSQPMFNGAQTIGVVFNGEIYNFAQLRSELQAHGHAFMTRSDTEVLVHGYAQWREAVVDRLRGMFAFALWDAEEERLLIARDRLGIKPFYYWYNDDTGELTFASEIKSLFANAAVPREPNQGRLAEYLLFRSVAGADTLFAGVRELEPGTLGVLDIRGLRIRRYWSPALPPVASASADPIADGRLLLKDAVESHMVSDVGLGTITSGGLDSSLVSALAAGSSPTPIDTFCMGFDEPSLDERPFARQVADRIGSRHHDSVLSANDFADSLDHLTSMHDEPLSHPNAIAMHRVFAQARDEVGIPVLLSGEGADEVFGGYDWYRAAFKLDRVRGLLGKSLTSAALKLLLRGPRRDVAGPDYLLLANALGRTPEVMHIPGVVAAVDRRRDVYGALCATTSGLFLYDQVTYLQPLLQRQDRMSMAVGLEARVPFLDHPLVEWANSLSVGAKLGRGQPKDLLRRMAKASLPREIIYREKVGFALPVADWLRGPLRARLAVLEDGGSLSANILGPRVTRQALSALDQGLNHTATFLWTLLALEVWDERFFKGEQRAQVGATAGSLT